MGERKKLSRDLAWPLIAFGLGEVSFAGVTYVLCLLVNNPGYLCWIGPQFVAGIVMFLLGIELLRDKS